MRLFRRSGPPRPKQPKMPPAPTTWPGRYSPQATLVRVYEGTGLLGGAAKDAARKFEVDAAKLAQDGYEPLSTAGQPASPATVLLGGVGLLAGGTLTVTYRLTADVLAAREHEYRTKLAAYDRAYEEWLNECERLRARYRQELREWSGGSGSIAADPPYVRHVFRGTAAEAAEHLKGLAATEAQAGRVLREASWCKPVVWATSSVILPTDEAPWLETVFALPSQPYERTMPGLPNIAAELVRDLA